MEDLLLLVHRIPYPPNKGDKIRSYHLLKFLKDRYRVHLGCFVDDPEDLAHLDELRGMVASLEAVTIRPRVRRVGSLLALLTGESLSGRYYASAAMTAYVRRTLDAGVRRVVTFSSPMNQFLPKTLPSGTRVLADFVDVDSHKWSQYGERKRWPLSWLYRHEAGALGRAEAAWAAAADHTLLVTADEAALFGRLQPKLASRVRVVENGVDTARFSPDAAGTMPWPAETGPVAVFVGAMDYWPNIDAARWFVDEVWPKVRARRPDAQFFIVGMKPAPAVLKLAATGSVVVTGSVPDVRPYVAHAHAVVAPLRIARGVQNKVLEGLAMARPLCATREALDGISLPPALRASLQFDAPEAMAERLLALFAEAPMELAEHRDFVEQHYGWDHKLSVLEELLGGNVDSEHTGEAA